jgi:hypothetical protein
MSYSVASEIKDATNTATTLNRLVHCPVILERNDSTYPAEAARKRQAPIDNKHKQNNKGDWNRGSVRDTTSDPSASPTSYDRITTEPR